MRKILVVDLCLFGQSGGGHTEFYFMNILSIFSKHYDVVYACCGSNKRLRENIERENLQNSLKNCQVLDIDVTLSDKIFRRLLLLFDKFIPKIPGINDIQFSSLINLTIVKRLMANLGEEIPVFFPYTDSIVPAVPRFISSCFFPHTWAGLHIMPSYQLKITQGMAKSRGLFYREQNFLLPSCKSILVLHPIYQRFFEKRFRRLNCFYFPELVDITEKDKNYVHVNHELLNSIKEKAKGRRIISILGNIMPRKNLPLFLESTSKLSPEQYFVLVLGKVKFELQPADTDKIDFFQKYLIHNSHIDTNYFIQNETEFSALIQLSDIIFCHYQDFPFSSSILTKAMAHGKPVIVNQGYLMEKIINQYQWKMALPGKADIIAAAIEKFTASGDRIPNSAYTSFLQDHSLEKFESCLIQACKNLQ